jgi:hypothetical protein
MSNYLESSYWSELCLARYYVKLNNPVFSVMSKACLLCWLCVYIYDISIELTVFRLLWRACNLT